MHHRVDGERAPVGRQRPGRLTRERLGLAAILAGLRRRRGGHETVTAESGLGDGAPAVALLSPLRAVGDERLAVRALAVVARHRARDLEVGAVLLDDELDDGGLRRRLGLRPVRRLLPVTLTCRELALRGSQGPGAAELWL